MPGEFPQDFELKDLTIISADGKKQNVRWVMRELSVFEDIWANCITATLVITDAQNLLMNHPIFGFEKCRVVFLTPDKQEFDLTFRIYKVSDRKLDKERKMSYMLHMVAQEELKNLTVRVSKAYNGKLISDIVSDLHKNWLGGGKIDVETTKYQHHVIIPNLHPILAINWLATRSNSTGQEGAQYLYYQDSKQFNFVSMESKLQAESEITYLHQPANIRQDTTDGYKPRDVEKDSAAIQSYSFTDHSDILANTLSGMYGSELITHSNERKKWERFTFDYPSDFSKFKHLEDNMLYSDAAGDLASKNNKLRFFPKGHEPYPFKVENWLKERISQLQQLNNTRLTITVAGDSDRTVGQVVEVELPSPEPPISNSQVIDKFYKGRYLIVALRHMITPKSYTTTMELVKDSVFTAYP